MKLNFHNIELWLWLVDKSQTGIYQAPHKLGMVTHAYYPSTQEVETQEGQKYKKSLRPA